MAFSTECNLNIVEIADIVLLCNLDLNTANCFYVMFKLRNHVGMSIITGMVGLNALTCKPKFTSRICDGTFVLLCSKLIHVMFYALDEKEKNEKLLSEPGL